MFQKLCTVAVISMAMASAQLAQAATKEEMVAFVKKAAAHIKKVGKEAAFKEFNNQQDKAWHEGELYMYVYDYKLKCLSHGARVSLIGTDASNVKDPDGKMVIADLAKIAKEKKDGGFYSYKWANPAHGNKVEQKLGYVMDMDGEYWIGSGIYESK